MFVNFNQYKQNTKYNSIFKVFQDTLYIFRSRFFFKIESVKVHCCSLPFSHAFKKSVITWIKNIISWNAIDIIDSSPYKYLKRNPIESIKKERTKKLKTLNNQNNIEHAQYLLKYRLKPTETPTPKIFGVHLILQGLNFPVELICEI